MADNYIDVHEVVGYGVFAAAQMKSLLMPLDETFHAPIEALSTRIQSLSEKMSRLLSESGALEKVTYRGVMGSADDHLAHGRDVLRRLYNYAASIKDNLQLPDKLLGHKAMSTVMRMRGTKLVGALRVALSVFDEMGTALPEYASRRQELAETIDDLDHLDKAVRHSRSQRRDISPEIQALREEFLQVYGAAKHLARCILSLSNSTQVLSDIFDDLAETHRVAGVKDDELPAPSAATTP